MIAPSAAVYVTFGAVVDTVTFLVTVFSFPAVSFTLYVTLVTPAFVVSTLVGLYVYVPSILLVVSLAITPFVKFTVPFNVVTISLIPLNDGNTVSTLITLLHFFSLSFPALSIPITHN